MSLLSIFVLAIVQGITEFLPVSSSAHLILVPRFFGWPDQGLTFDIAVHVGSLIAVVVYFRAQLIRIVVDTFRWPSEGGFSADTRLGFGLIVATIPAAIVGFTAKDWIETTLRSPLVIAASTATFGLLLAFSDWRGARQRSEHDLGMAQALAIGIAQTFALIPGTSRSGVTMTAALLLGLNREAAARFSFLLSIPIIAGAGLEQVIELVRSPTPVPWFALSLAAGFATLSAYLCIRFFLGIVGRVGMMPFVAYRLALAALLLLLFG